MCIEYVAKCLTQSKSLISNSTELFFISSLLLLFLLGLLLLLLLCHSGLSVLEFQILSMALNILCDMAWPGILPSPAWLFPSQELDWSPTFGLLLTRSPACKPFSPLCLVKPYSSFKAKALIQLSPWTTCSNHLHQGPSACISMVFIIIMKYCKHTKSNEANTHVPTT